MSPFEFLLKADICYTDNGERNEKRKVLYNTTNVHAGLSKEDSMPFIRFQPELGRFINY